MLVSFINHAFATEIDIYMGEFNNVCHGYPHWQKKLQTLNKNKNTKSEHHAENKWQVSDQTAYSITYHGFKWAAIKRTFQINQFKM